MVTKKGNEEQLEEIRGRIRDPVIKLALELLQN